MKSFLSSLRKLDTPLKKESKYTASKSHIQLLTPWLKNSGAINKYARKGIPGISLSLYTSLLTIGASIGIGITFNPQRSWAGSTCVGTYSSRSGVSIDPITGQVATSASSSVIGYFNNITSAYVPLVNYAGGNNINAIATQPSTGNLFFVNRATGKIVVYNPNANTQATLPGGLSVAGPPASTTIIGATFNASGNLYIYYSNKTLVEVSPVSGNAVGSAITITGIPGITGRPATPQVQGITGGTTNGDIAIGTNGVLYAMGDTSGTGASGVNDYTSRLYSISISGSTATATPVVNSNITGLDGSAANGLAIDPATGKFYISSSLGTYELDPSTNAATQLTNVTGTNDLAACGAPTPDLPTINKGFSPDNVVGIPANSTLTLTLGNTNQVPIFLLAPLVDNFQTGLAVGSPNSLGGTCLLYTANSSKITAVANSNSITLLDGLRVPVGGCTVTVNVTASNAGEFVNTIAAGALKTTAGNNTSATTTTVTVPNIDYGDAPITGTAPNGIVTNAYGQAIHAVVAGIKLGATIDSETASIANSTATGDGADDDGVSSFPTLTAGDTSYSIPTANITTTGTGTLHAWIDFNKNGTFDSGEHTSVAVTNNTLAGALNWAGITAGAAGNTFARFRFTSDTAVIASTPSGNASNGEVEDYQVPIGAGSTALLCGTIYGSYNNGGIFNGLRGYSPSSGSLATQIAALTTPGGTTTTVAAIAVDPILDNDGNRRVYYMENTGTNAKLFYYNGSTTIDASVALTVPYSPLTTVRSDGSTGSLTNTFNRMGFAPDGTLYIADGQRTYYRFSPNRSGSGGSLSSATTITDSSNNDIGNFGRAKVSQSGGGDIAFDNAGRMYIVTYDSDSANIPTEFRLFQIINPQSSTPTAVLLGREPSTDPVAGLAFQASDNILYMQGSGGKSFGWNLATNTVTPLTQTTPGSADLGSCTYPDLNPTGAFTKTVNNITNPGANVLSINDILEYTLDVTNNGNLIAGNSTLVDPIPVGTTYVTGSTKLNGITQADNSGAMPYANTTIPKPVNSPGEASGVLTAGTTRKATVVFRVRVNVVNSKICNQSNVFYDGSSPSGVFSDDPTTTTVADDQTCTGVNKAKLVLVKRITAIKRNGTTSPQNFTTFVDDSLSTTPTSDDNHCNWPGATGSAGACTNTYTIGTTSIPDVRTGDEVEYTIYYLNGGMNPAKKARVCDQLDTNLTFQTQFDINDPTTIGKGLVLAEGTTTEQYLTNTGSDDKGELTTPTLAVSCNLGARVSTSLSNDVVVVDVGTNANPLMNSTSAGTPLTSYGYIRFKAKVK